MGCGASKKDEKKDKKKEKEEKAKDDKKKDSPKKETTSPEKSEAPKKDESSSSGAGAGAAAAGGAAAGAAAAAGSSEKKDDAAEEKKDDSCPVTGARQIVLPHDDSDFTTRCMEVLEQKKDYNWAHHHPDLPPYVAELPEAEKGGDIVMKKLNTFGDLIGIKASLTLAKALDELGEAFCVKEEEPFQDWKDLFEKGPGVVKLPEVAKTWDQDQEFAAQRLTGLNPTLIRKCAAIPENLDISDATLKNEAGESLIGSHTLEGLLGEGRLYVCNYEDLAKIPNVPEDRCLTFPIALFWANDDKTLMPLAIQLSQNKGDLIFTPHDPKGCWLAAKIHVQTADLTMHEVGAHLGATHVMMEGVYVAMMRNLHKRHPINEMMRQHFWYTIAINISARNNLISKDGGVPKLLPLGYEATGAFLCQIVREWNFKRYDIPAGFPRRGLEPSGVLNDFHWRDDATKVWDIMFKYCSAMVNDFYADDEALTKDNELIDWAKELTAPREEGGGCGFVGIEMTDNRFATRDQLCKFLCGVLYNVSAGHSAVNNGQFDLMGFVPNVPGTFKLPAMKTKDDIKMDDIVKALPNYEYTADMITLVYILSAKSDDLIGSYSSDFMESRPKSIEIMKEFKADLAKLSEDLTARDEKLKAEGKKPYIYLNPNQMAQGIAI